MVFVIFTSPTLLEIFYFQAFDPSGRRSPDTETHFKSLVTVMKINCNG